MVGIPADHSILSLLIVPLSQETEGDKGILDIENVWSAGMPTRREKK